MDPATFAVSLCLAAGCSSTPIVQVDDPRNMPSGLVAYTTFDVGRCTLTFTSESIKRRAVVAHEVCHCLNDAAVLTAYGYSHALNPSEVARREREAQACAKRLSRG